MTSLKKTVSIAVITSVAALGLALVPSVAFGVDFNSGYQGGVEAARGADVPDTLIGDGGIVTSVINVMLFIVGFLSVVMLIFGGLRYIISGGNSSAVTTAKNTILYAIVGLVIAIFAYSIVNFVVGSFASGFGGAGGTNV